MTVVSRWLRAARAVLSLGVSSLLLTGAIATHVDAQQVRITALQNFTTDYWDDDAQSGWGTVNIKVTNTGATSVTVNVVATDCGATWVQCGGGLRSTIAPGATVTAPISVQIPDDYFETFDVTVYVKDATSGMPYDRTLLHVTTGDESVVAVSLVSLPTMTFTPALNPHAAPATYSGNTNGNLVVTLGNVGNAPTSYSVSVHCSGVVISCSGALNPVIVQPGGQVNPVMFRSVGASGGTGRLVLVATAPPRPDGIVESDSSVWTITTADVAPPTITIASFGFPVQTPYGPANEVDSPTFTLGVDVCDSDGNVGTPSALLDGAAISPASVTTTTMSGCFTAKHATYTIAPHDGFGTIGVTVSDGFHTVSSGVAYTHDGAPDAAPVITAPPSMTHAWDTPVADTFVVTNPGHYAARYSIRMDPCLTNTPLVYLDVHCSMPSADTLVTIGAGASLQIPVSYAYGGRPGTITTQTLSATFYGASDTTASSRYAMVTSVAVDPPKATFAGSTYNTTPFNLASPRIDWCDVDDAIIVRVVQWEGGAVLPDIGVATSAPNCVSAFTSAYVNLTLQPWQQVLVATVFDASGHATVSKDTIFYNTPLNLFGPDVTPLATKWHVLAASATSAADTFTVANAGIYPATYAITPRCGALGTLSNCVANPTAMSLAPGTSQRVIVSYSRGGALDVADTIGAIATYTSPIGGVIADTGGTVVAAPSHEVPPTITGLFAAQATPHGGSILQVAVSWLLVNRSPVQETFDLHAVSSSPVNIPVSGMVSEIFDGTFVFGSPITLNPGDSALVEINSQPGNEIGIGVITLTASYTTTTGAVLGTSGTETITVALPPQQHVRLIAGPKTSLQVSPNATVAQHFTVTNSGDSAATVTYAVNCTGAAIASCSAPNHATTFLEPNQSDVVVVNAHSASGFGLSGTVSLIASAGFSVADTARITFTTASIADLSVTTAGLNSGASIAREQCLTIAAGTDGAYECGSLRLVHPLPTTTTMNKARTPTLIYMSDHAHPRTLIGANVMVQQ